MTALPHVLTDLDLPYPELCAARLDGELFSLDSCFASIDVPEFAQLRAESIAIAWPGRLIAEQHSAAWVLGATPVRPTHHELCADIGARARPANNWRVLIREVVIAPDEIVRVGALDVTSPLRTVLDLARSSEIWSDEERRITHALMRMGRFTPADCRHALESRRNLPGKKRALARIPAER